MLITNTDDSQLCNILLYPTLYLTMKQLNSNQAVGNETNKHANKNQLPYSHQIPRVLNFAILKKTQNLTLAK